MSTDRDLARRVEELENQVAKMRQRPLGIRHRSQAAIGDWPLWSIALGPDLSRGEMRGRARGVVAIGDIATGVVALGGPARGVFAFGGLSLGVFTFGGLSLALLVAMGGGAVGGVAIGGGAVGGVAVGGGAFGYYAAGGGAGGHVVCSPARRDPQAVDLFTRLGLGKLCEGGLR